MTIADSLSFADAWNVEILATDVGRHALKHAESGIYKGRSIASVSERQLANHFTKVSGGHQGKPRLRKMVSFTQMNLASAVYLSRMESIFFIKVIFYFSEERRRPHGHVFLRSSEPASS